MIRLKRAYEPASPEDGFQVLVERLVTFVNAAHGEGRNSTVLLKGFIETER